MKYIIGIFSLFFLFACNHENTPEVVLDTVVQGFCNGSPTELFVQGPLDTWYSRWDINGDKQCDLYLHRCCGFTANHGTFWSLVMEDNHDNVFIGHYKEEPTLYHKVDTMVAYNTSLAAVHYTEVTTQSCEPLIGDNIAQSKDGSAVFIADSIDDLMDENISWQSGSATIPYIANGTAQPTLSGGSYDTLFQTLKVIKLDCDFPAIGDFKYFTIKTVIDGQETQVAVKFTMSESAQTGEVRVSLQEVIRI